MRSFVILASTFLLCIVVVTMTAQPITDAQGDVGIGTNSPDPSAILDLTSTSKGLLLPRMTTTMRDAITLPATGLMIFNTGSSEFQYNYGTPSAPLWTRIITDETLENNVWMLEGNTGTTPFDGVAGDFLGTADDVDFVIATGSTEQGRFYSPANGGGFGLAGPLVLNGTTGTTGQVLVSQGAGAAPAWSGTLSLDSLAVDQDLTVGGDLTVNGNTIFNGTVDFSTLPNIPLAEGSLLVGDASGQAAPFPAGASGEVLQIDGSGNPSWQTVNLLPAGTGTNTLLVWNGTAWVENTNVTSDPSTGNTVIGGDLTVNGGVTLPPGSVDNTELANSTINVSYGTGLSGDASVALGGTLNLQNTGVTSITGTPDQVNVSGGGTGAVTLSLPQDIDPDATPTFDGVILDALSGGSTATEVVTSNGGTLETRSITSLIGDATLTEGSLWVGDASNNPAELAAGADGQVLTIVGGVPAWGAATPASTDVTTASTTDEAFAIRGTASGGTANQVAGVWGRATDPSAGNTGTIGVFAVGNGNTTAGQTNAALQLNDGELRMGRTTETGTGYTVVEGGAAGTAYTAEGPSGVIEFNLSLANSSPLAGALVGVLNTLGTPLGAPTLGTTINGLLGASVFNTTITINNRYVSPESIVLTQVLAIDDTDLLTDLITLFQNGTLTASSAVTNRQAGSFDYTIDLRALGAIPAVSSGTIRVGYVVINPGR